MKYIVVGTNRAGSNSRKIAGIIQQMYVDVGEQVEIIDLANLPFENLTGQYGKELHPQWQSEVDKITKADGLIMIVPEYNGSMPGALKYFIDHWKYPESFEFRPVCFIGLGGLFGGLRPVEHLQQVFGYRNAYIFPQRVFLQNVSKLIIDGKIQDPIILNLLKDQVTGFKKFVKALCENALDANSVNLKRVKK